MRIYRVPDRMSAYLTGFIRESIAMASLVLTKHKISYLRVAAKDLGLTFTDQKTYIDNQRAYCLVSRKTGDIVSKGYTVASALEAQTSGQWNKLSEVNRHEKASKKTNPKTGGRQAL